jgi:hypothetical protein
MTPSTPVDPKIFHITHVENLPGIIAAGGLWSDHQTENRGLQPVNIAHQHIKARRRTRTVNTASGGMLADYVPFNFCPRSVMLYAIHCGHLDYDGGQNAVVHLVSSVQQAIATGRPWVFTDRHAELAHAQQYTDLRHLDQVTWSAMPRPRWTDVKEVRQAEFLVRDFFDRRAIVEVVARTEAMAALVSTAFSNVEDPPTVVVQPKWYY